MPPTLVCLDRPDRLSANSISLSKGTWSYLPLCGANVKYVGLGEFGASVGFARRTSIEGGRYPLQVRHAVIRPASVLVVYMTSYGARADERLGDQNVNVPFLDVTISTKAHLRIAITSDNALQDVANVGITAARGFPAHVPKTRNVVPTLVPNDRTPFFGGCGRLRLHRKTPFGAMQRDGSGRRRCTYYTTDMGRVV